MTRIAAALILILLLNSTTALAQELTMTAALDLSQIYKPGSWQPVLVRLQNETDREIEGSVVLPLSDPRAPSVMQMAVRVPGRSRVRAKVWGYFPATPPGDDSRRGQNETPPLGTAEWRSADGGVLARAQVLGVPVGMSADEGERENGELVLLVSDRADAGDEAHDVQSLLGRLSEETAVPMSVAGVELDAIPRQPGGLHAVKAIILDAVEPQSFDVAQRQVLLDYVRGGGTIVLAAPSIDVAQPASWLQPLLPARPIGSRLANEIAISSDGTRLKLRQPLAIVEAIEAGGAQVLLRDGDYVHVALMSVGLGKSVFTSFPINGLDESQPQVQILWQQLLSLNQPHWEWNRSQLGEQRHQILGSMIGRKVAPWGIAAALAGGYVLLVIIAQAMFIGPSRPKAFVVSVAGALLLSGALVVMAMARRTDQSLQSARLTVIDVSGGGGGVASESITYIGTDDPDMALKSISENVTIRPALADARNRPTIRQQPFAVDKAQVFTDRIERVWEAASPLPITARLAASARFGPDGLTLVIDNGLYEPIEAPLLLTNRRALAIDDLAMGQSTITGFRLNARGDYTSSTMLTSDEAKRRAQIIHASLTATAQGIAGINRPAPPPLLVGWGPAERVHAMIQPAQTQVKDEKAMVMIRTPLRIETPAPGTTIAVPSAFVEIDTEKLPYDHDSAETVPSREIGDWLINFAAPRELGAIRPARVKLEIRVALPQHSLSVRKGQCSNGRSKINRAGDAVAEWSGEVGLREVTIECSPDDYDSDGRVWLLLEVRPADMTATNPAPWQIKDLAMSIESAEAIGPLPPIAFDLPPPADETEY